LSSHTLRVSKKKGKNDTSPTEYYPLDRLPINKDLFVYLQDFFKRYQTPVSNTQQQTYMKVTNLRISDRIIVGTVKSGIFGVNSEILDMKTDTVSHEKQDTEADVLTFYFLISILEGADEGIILFQRTGRYGFQTNFTNFLKKSFQLDFPQCEVDINNLVSKDIIRKIVRGGSIKELKCVKYKTPIDIVDGLDTGHEEISANIEFVVKGNRIPFRNKLDDFLKDDGKVTELIEIRNFNFDYDTVKVDVENKGTTYHYDLGAIGDTRQNLDITNDIELDSQGKPILSSIHRRAVRYLTEIRSALYQ
jgi:hypothetical protein